MYIKDEDNIKVRDNRHVGGEVWSIVTRITIIFRNIRNQTLHGGGEDKHKNEEGSISVIETRVRVPFIKKDDVRMIKGEIASNNRSGLYDFLVTSVL